MLGSSAHRTPLVVLVLYASLAAVAGGPTLGCRTPPAPLPGPSDAGLSGGAPAGLLEPTVVNRRDFIYALAFDDTTSRLAFVHHVTTSMELTVTKLAPLMPLFQQPVNSSEFDVEDVAFATPTRVVTVSRKGNAQVFDALTGKPVGDFISGEALLRVALRGSDQILAVGSGEGRVLLLDANTLAFVGEGRTHEDEIRGLAFLPDGRLVSASQDGSVAVSTLEAGTDGTARLPTTTLKSGDHAFLAHLDGIRAIATMRDGRQTSNVISAAAVRRLGLKPIADGGQLPLILPTGSTTASAVELGEVRLRHLSLGVQRAAVCDACVPPGAELILGADALAKVVLTDDVAHDEVVAKPSAGDAPAQFAARTLQVRVASRIALPGPATDIDVAATGAVLVAFSPEKAERTFALYEHEKKGEYPELSEGSAAALVDIAAGTLGTRFVGHRGFTVTAGISPDGRTVVTGGWDKRLLLYDAVSGQLVAERRLGWLVRRARFSKSGAVLGVAAWTPVNALNEGNSEPAMLLYPLAFEGPR